ncbi:MAG: hypothetical protein LBP86_02470 [Azoarcus sp.]|jgi:hypothetical protein|nr:hypothetical protein [Azoarcus sp.]
MNARRNPAVSCFRHGVARPRYRLDASRVEAGPAGRWRETAPFGGNIERGGGVGASVRFRPVTGMD